MTIYVESQRGKPKLQEPARVDVRTMRLKGFFQRVIAKLVAVELELAHQNEKWL
jgi:hypothetical protein